MNLLVVQTSETYVKCSKKKNSNEKEISKRIEKFDLLPKISMILSLFHKNIPSKLYEMAKDDILNAKRL